VLSAVFSPDGARVLTASADRTAQVWEVRTGTPAGLPLRHREAVLSAVFSPDGTRVLTASADGTARLWDAAPGSREDVPLLIELLELAVGHSLNPEGATAILEDQFGRLERLRRRMASRPVGDSGAASFSRWWLDNPWQRTTSPLSTMSVERYIQDCLDHQTVDEAARAFPGHPMLSGFRSPRPAGVAAGGR